MTMKIRKQITKEEKMALVSKLKANKGKEIVLECEQCGFEFMQAQGMARVCPQCDSVDLLESEC